MATKRIDIGAMGGGAAGTKGAPAPKSSASKSSGGKAGGDSQNIKLVVAVVVLIAALGLLAWNFGLLGGGIQTSVPTVQPTAEQTKGAAEREKQIKEKGGESAGS